MNSASLLCILFHFASLFLQHDSQAVIDIAIPYWPIVGKNQVNRHCYFNSKGVCKGFCPLTLKKCAVLTNFNQKVCGCEYCAFDPEQQKCVGQCQNTILQNCVSKVAKPKQNSDCVCASCKTNLPVAATTQADGYISVPECDSRTCHNNGCMSFYPIVRGNRLNSTLYCVCNNN